MISILIVATVSLVLATTIRYREHHRLHGLTEAAMAGSGLGETMVLKVAPGVAESEGRGAHTASMRASHGLTKVAAHLHPEDVLSTGFVIRMTSPTAQAATVFHTLTVPKQSARVAASDLASSWPEGFFAVVAADEAGADVAALLPRLALPITD